MSILINTKMPDACPNCPFVMAYYCLLIGISDENEVTNYINKRHPDCPLTELPPHGRLIDADKLMRDIEEYHLSDGKFQHWVEVQQTIIEAEGSEE